MGVIHTVVSIEKICLIYTKFCKLFFKIEKVNENVPFKKPNLFSAVLAPRIFARKTCNLFWYLDFTAQLAFGAHKLFVETLHDRAPI